MKIPHWMLLFYRLISDGSIRFGYLTKLGLLNRVHDKKFLYKKYKSIHKTNVDLDNPSTFNEKLQWLKLYDRNPNYTVMVDKYKVREYIAEKIGEQYLIPLIGVWESPDEINFDALPNQFVMKCNHNSGLGMCICTDKSKLHIKKVRKDLARGLKQDYYLIGREWPYKDVPRRIVAEQFLKNDAGGLTDYKIHCFNGKPKFVLVCQDRFAETGLTEDFFTIDWEHMEVKRPNHNNSKLPISKPDKLEEMLSIAEKLSNGIPFVRVDLYFVEGNIFFSELTFFPASGFIPFEPEEWDKTFGDWLVFPNKTEISE